MVTATARIATASISPKVSFVFIGSCVPIGIFTPQTQKSSEKIWATKPRFSEPKRGE
jgi:hypothetical protein